MAAGESWNGNLTSTPPISFVTSMVMSFCKSVPSAMPPTMPISATYSVSKPSMAAMFRLPMPSTL